jgi:hypothetical protein
MAKVHGISGSTRYLLKGTKAINGKKLATLEDIDHFHNHYETILAEIQITVQQQQDEMILSLGNNEVRLDSQLRESIAIRTVEVDGKINEIATKIENTENVIIFLGYKVQHWVARSLRSHRIHSPLSHLSRELRNVQSRKASLITNKPYVIKNECNNVISNQKFITENISFLIGAKGEEHVISVLSQLPDEYHVLNDVNLIFSKYIYWKKRNEHIKTCQIDHIVIGPTGIILLETKNWKTSDIGKKSDDLTHQVQRANYALWYYLKDSYGLFGNAPKIRSVVVSLHGQQPGTRIDKYIDVITPHRLCGYITSRENTLSEDAIHKLIQLIPCREVH